MLAAVYTGKKRIKLENVEMPKISKNEILLKVKTAAICGTDLRIYRSGHFKIKKGEKRILGHEFSGVIEKVGSNVSGYREGMSVGVAPNIGCGKCRYCRMGLYHLCPDYEAFGISMDGAFAEYVKIPEMAIRQGNLILFDSDKVGYDELALAEPLSCCYNAYRSVKTKAGDLVLIIGAGPMGILHLLLQRLAGARGVIVADISDRRLKLLERYNVDLLVNSNKDNLYEAVMDFSDGMGMDVIITACPDPEVQQMSIKLAAKLGRINLFGGLPAENDDVKFNTNIIHYNGLVVTGTTGGSLFDYERSIDLISSRKIDVKSIISKKFYIKDFDIAFNYALSGEGLKTEIIFDN